MRIVVHYENPEEQRLAERLVPDIEAVAKFAADVLDRQTDISVLAAADFNYSESQAYTLSQIEAMRSVPNPVMGSVIPGGQAPHGMYGVGGRVMTVAGTYGEPVRAQHNRNAQNCMARGTRDHINPLAVCSICQPGLPAPMVKCCGKCGGKYTHASCPFCLARMTASKTPLLMNREALSRIIDSHCSGWIDNGKPTCRCMCDYQPKRLGERHSDHVADDILSKLGVLQ